MSENADWYVAMDGTLFDNPLLGAQHDADLAELEREDLKEERVDDND